jgi:hypothetical protein
VLLGPSGSDDKGWKSPPPHAVHPAAMSRIFTIMGLPWLVYGLHSRHGTVNA